MLRKLNDHRLIHKLKRSQTKSEKFEHLPLNTSNDEVRFLKLEEVLPVDEAQAAEIPSILQTRVVYASLSHVSFAKAPEYVALSYTWGSAAPTYLLYINNRKFMIRANLHEALLQLFDTGYEYLWIDAICINQGDTLEKSKQIHRLAALFREATEVVAWIGLHDADSRIVFNFLKTSDQPDGTGKLSDNTHPLLRQALKGFAARAYWSRVWVVQEFALAKKVVVRCGPDSFSSHKLDTLILAYDELCNDMGALLLKSLSTLTFIRDWQLEGQKLGLLDMFRFTTESAVQLKPGNVIWTVRPAFRSTDLIDQVYGFLGLVEDGKFFIPEPDYDLDISKLFQYATKSAIERILKLDFILLESAHSKSDAAAFGCEKWRDYKPEALPSWCPDYLNLLDSTQNAELVFAVFPNATIPVRSIPSRLGTTDLSWSATIGTSIANHYRFTGSGLLMLEGKFLGRIVENKDWYHATKADLTDLANEAQTLWLAHLLLAYADRAPDEAVDISATVVSLFTESRCGCATDHMDRSEACRSRQQSVKSMMDDGLANDIGHSVVQTLSSSELRSDRRDGDVVDFHLACTMLYSLYCNYFNCDRRVWAYEANSMDPIVVDIGRRAGKFGWMPKLTEPNDEIWLFPGCSMPIILRRVDAQSDKQSRVYTRVGPAVINGAMTGDMWTPHQLETIAIA